MKYVIIFILLMGCDQVSTLDSDSEFWENELPTVQDSDTATEALDAMSTDEAEIELPAICDLITDAYGDYCESWPYDEGLVGTCGRVMDSLYECLLSCSDMYSERCARGCKCHHDNYTAYCPDDWRAEERNVRQ